MKMDGQAMKCALKIIAKEDNIKMYIKDCSDKKSVMVDLQKDCGNSNVEPAALRTKIRMIKEAVWVIVEFDKPMNYRKDGCEAFQPFRK